LDSGAIRLCNSDDETCVSIIGLDFIREVGEMLASLGERIAEDLHNLSEYAKQQGPIRTSS
jgi:hypothetical protein